MRVGLNQERAFAPADLGDEIGHRRSNDLHVGSIDLDPDHAVSRRPFDDGDRMLRRRGRELGVAVVLAEEDDRQLPHCGQIDGLVERAGSHGPVSEEGDRHAVVAAQTSGERGTDGDRQPSADDPVCTQHSDRGIGDVHRAAAAAARTRVTSEQLGEHRAHVHSLGEAVTMASVGRRDVVGRSQWPATPDRRRFLPDADVHESRYFGRLVQFRHPFLETADAQHAPVQLDQIGLIEGSANIVRSDIVARAHRHVQTPL